MAEGSPSLTDFILGRGKRSAPVDDETPKEDTTGGKSDLVQEPTSPQRKKFNTTKIVYSHRKLVSTFGYNYNVISSADWEDDYGSHAKFITTPYARVPCHGIPFYMSQTEFCNLPRGSEVKLCKVTCRPIGFRTPFLTNSAAVAYVNSSLMVHGMFAHGLNNKYGGKDFAYAADTNDPCIPTSINIDLKEDCNPEKFWGKRYNTTSANIGYGDIGACFGREIPLQTYYTKLHMQNTIYDEWLDNSFEDLEIFTMTPNNMGGPSINWEYRPQVCVLKPFNTLRGWQRNAKNKWETVVLYGSKVQLQAKAYPWRKQTKFLDNIQLDSGDFEGTQRGATSSDSLLESGFLQFYTSYIEHSGSQCHGLSEYGGGVQPPSLHIGMLPINAWYDKEDVKAVMPCTTQWIIDSEIHIEASSQYIDPWMSAQHPNAVSMCNIYDLQIGSYPSTQFGYKSAWHSKSGHTQARMSMDKNPPATTTEATPTASTSTTTAQPGSGRLQAKMKRK